MAGEQSFKAVVNDTNPKYGGRAVSVEITGSNYNHFLGKIGKKNLKLQIIIN